MVMQASTKENGDHDYKAAIVDALIICGFTFFSSLAAIASTGSVDMGEGLMRAGIATGVAFFSSLMLSLGVQKPR
jgi:hypothetical protein